jgi:hypothetical protein
VYSPQYGLWLLPLFAIALPDIRAFVAFELADIAVFITRFTFFGAYGTGDWDAQFARFEIALWVRAAVLLWCLVAWVRRPPGELEGAIAFELPPPSVRAQASG